MNELCNRSALELAAMIRAKDVSSREVVDAHLARIEAVNPTVNAITVVLADQARAAADAADRSEPTRPVARRADHGEGEHRPGGHAHHERPHRARRGDAHGERTGGRTHARGRRDPDRAHQPARARAAHRHQQRAARPHRERVEPGTHARRVERWRGFGDRVTHVAPRARQRHRWLAAGAGVLQRRGRACVRRCTACPRPPRSSRSTARCAGR